jgi:hypothetical protein
MTLTIPKKNDRKPEPANFTHSMIFDENKSMGIAKHTLISVDNCRISLFRSKDKFPMIIPII